MRSIEKLPEDIRSSIRSGVILYDLTRVVEELVYNSLDAGADKVSIDVGVGTCYVKVVDNGSGVSRDGLDLIGERYATSRYDPLDDMHTRPLGFGYRGEALSSIADVSLVEIVTKAHGRPNGYHKVLKGCKCLYLGINDDRLDVGTTVTVRDLFYNQPVRRKQMLSNPKKVLHTIKECVLRIALVHPNVSFKVVDIESEDVLLHTRPFPSPLSLLARSFGIEASNSLEELNVVGGRFKLSGYISGTLDILSWKVFQYAYINSRFISKGPIHKVINNLAASFIIGSQDEKQNRSQICPAFVLNLQCPKSKYDLTFEPSKTSVEFKDWDSVLTFIGDAVGRLWSRGKSADLPVNSEIGKKRRRALNCLVPEGIPLKSKKLIEECNSFPASRENLSSSANLHVIVSEKLNTDCRFVGQIDHPDQESDISPSHCRVVLSGQCSSDLSPLPHNMFSPEDTFLDNDLFCLNRSYRQANDIFSSEWEGASPKIDAGTDRLLPDQVKLSNSLELIDSSDVSADVRKPFLQSCFLRRRLKHGETCLATDEEFDFEIVGHSKKNEFRADGTVVEEVNDIKKITSSRNVWHNEQPDVLRFSKTTMQHDIIEDVKKPFLQSCFLGRRLKHGEISLATDEEFEFEIHDHSKQNAFSVDGMAVEEIDHINKIMSQRDVWCNEQPDALSFSKNTTQHDVQQRTFFLRDTVNSTLNPEISDEDGIFLPDFVKPPRRYYYCPQPGSSISSPVQSNYLSRITFNNKAHTIHEDLVENCPEYDGHVRYELANKDNKGWRYDLDKISIDTGKECLFSSFKNLSSDVKDHAGFKENSSDFQEHDLKYPLSSMEHSIDFQERDLKYPLSSMEHSTDFQDRDLKDAFSPNSFNISTDCINNCGEGSIRNSCSSRHHTSSIDFDWESRIMAHPRNLRKVFVPYRRGIRSKSAPPFYRGRKKFIALSDSLTKAAGKINLQNVRDGTRLPETYNLKQIQSHSQINSVLPSLQSYQYDQSTTLHCEGDSFSDDIPDMGIIKIDKGKCKCHMDSFEESIPKDIQDSGKERQDSHPHLSSRSISLHYKNQDTILDIASGILHLASDSLVPRSLEKNCLEGAKVLQQVDKKFIPIVAGRTLALIDQHAADERIRLEELRRKVLSGEMRTTKYLDCEQELVIPEFGFQLLHDYAEQIQNWGWICNIPTQGSRSFTRNLNIMHKQQAVATLLAVPCILGVNLSDVDLLEFLQQLADTDGSSTIPPSVLRVLNNKACRGAIMFGDRLLPSECSLVVEELKHTSLCFQCAHGRPTTVPLVNLDALSEHIAKITSWSSGSCETWHGLRRHEISLERTAKRLNSAR